MAPEIPTRMKAVQIVEFNKPYETREINVPTDLEPPDLLIKVAVASYCHSDSRVQEGVFGAALPQTAGHEGSGTVVAVGSDAAKRFKIGDRVMCGLRLHPCETCTDCLGPEDQKQYCMNLGIGYLGLHAHGCFAEYVKCDSRSTTKLPDEVSFIPAAPFACAGRTAWRSVLKARLQKGEWLCIVGSGGGIGHLVIQFAKAIGLKVIGLENRDAGLDLSEKYGANIVVDSRKGKATVVDEVQAVTAGQGADATICLSDHKDSPSLACAVTKMHGTMVQIALPDIVEVPFSELIFRDIRIVGSSAAGSEETGSMLDIVAKHGVTVNMFLLYGLDKIDELIRLIHSGKLSGKAVVIVDPEQIQREKSLGATVGDYTNGFKFA
nr:alcohol dehydrogenase 5 [Quercus suber]